MRLGRVIGRVVATRKDQGLHARKLLLVQPLDAALVPRGRSLVVIDSVGAGPGEVVFWVRGREASYPFLPDATPADATIAGIVDPSCLPRGGSPS
jgi:ethanolamine utilization protein EutN